MATGVAVSVNQQGLPDPVAAGSTTFTASAPRWSVLVIVQVALSPGEADRAGRRIGERGTVQPHADGR
jgi:hypothetical protein